MRAGGAQAAPPIEAHRWFLLDEGLEFEDPTGAFVVVLMDRTMAIALAERILERWHHRHSWYVDNRVDGEAVLHCAKLPACGIEVALPAECRP